MPVRDSRSFNTRLFLHVLAFLLLLICGVMAYRSVGTGALKSINDSVGAVGANWWYYAAAIAALSTLSMGLLEFFKAILDARRWYQEQRLRSWVHGPAFEDLVFLAIGDWKSLDALCSQPIEKMMGEIQSGANIALDSPDRYPALYDFLTSTDLYEAADSKSLQVSNVDLASRDRELHRRRATLRSAQIRPVDAPPDPESIDAAKARIRLSNLVSRKLDAFQLRTQYYWDRGNQLAAISLSVGIVFMALTQDSVLTGGKIALGLVSGLVAPFVKDLATNLSQFATKT
jgi:hypothetical protein